MIAITVMITGTAGGPGGGNFEARKITVWGDVA